MVHYSVFPHRILICVINRNLTVCTTIHDSRLNQKGEAVFPKMKRRIRAITKSGKCSVSYFN